MVTILGAALAVLAMAANIGRGEFPIAITEVLSVLAGGGSEEQRFIVIDLRLPRALTGVLVGAALGISGAITSSIARNALATPDILGITAGASLAAVLIIVLGGTNGVVAGVAANVGLPMAALIGGLLTAVLIYALAYRRGIDGYRLVLVGIGVNAVLFSIVTYLTVRARIEDAAEAEIWLTGSLNNRGWEHVRPVALALAVLVPLALVLTFVLGALQFGDDTARGLGVRVNLARSGLLIAAVGLAAVATASGGPIGFVAFVAPQVAVRLTGGSRPPLLASAALGAALTVGADVVARTMLGDVELPVGIITSAVGAPFLIYLLARNARQSAL
ncbi:MAG: FecCD family ABC transporter permease [Sporichthyaceae bacterium]